MLSAIRGKLLFVGTGVFALGILYGTFLPLDWKYFFLSIFVGLFCVFLGISEPAENRNLKTFLFVLAVLLLVFPIGEVRAALAPLAPHALPSAYVSLLNNPISLTGTIVADPDIREKNQQLFISVERNGQHTSLLAFAPLFQQFAYGERVLIAGTLTAPTPFDTSDGRQFRYDNFLAKKDTFAVVPQADILEVAPPKGLSKFADFLFDCKHEFVAGLSHALPDPYAELATGLLTGDQHQLSDAIVAMLACSGLIWVVVLSGYHVTLLAEGVRRMFSFLPNRFSYALAGVSIVGIIFATGASAPSLRGGVMACLTLFSRATNRKYDALRALCFALIAILLWNPLLLAYDSGFQLSIVVTPALLLVTPLLEMKLLWIKSELVRESIAVSTVAQLACLPLILWQTGEVGRVGDTGKHYGNGICSVCHA